MTATKEHKAAYRDRNREALREKNRAYKRANPEKSVRQRQRRIEQQRALRAAATAVTVALPDWRAREIRLERERLRARERYARDPDRRAVVIANAKRRASEKRAEVTAYKARWSRDRQASDPVFRLAIALRRRVWVAFNRRGWTKRSSGGALLGADWPTVKLWIEERFSPGMSWENYGEWHIDHVTPLASATSEDELLSLFRFTNLQPLWAFDNMSKGARHAGAR